MFTWTHGSPAGTINEILEESHEIEVHLHSYERWLGAAVTPSGETHVADKIGDTTTAFRIDAGNEDWGSWTQVVGSADTPIVTGKTKFDFHRIEITASENAGVHFIQFAFGETGAAAYSNDDYAEFVFVEPVSQTLPEPIDVQNDRVDSGTKVWARLFVPGENTSTLDFYIGLHEYDQ